MKLNMHALAKWNTPYQFSLVMDNLLEFCSRRLIEDAPTSTAHVSIESYARDFKTVTLNCGRITGKTSFIAERAGPDDLIIATSSLMITHLRQMGIDPNATIITLSQSLMSSLQGTAKRQKFKTIFVDDCSYAVTHRNLMLDELYGLTANTDPEQRYILLG